MDSLTIHFSIDDVIASLRWAYENTPASIFDMDFYGILKRWHENYKLKVSLYCYGTDGKSFSVDRLQSHYKKEFIGEYRWIRLAYHGVYGDSYRQEKQQFTAEQKYFADQFERVLAKTVRLHGWQASEEELEEARKNGKVEKLLCPDTYSKDFFSFLPEKVKRQIFMGEEVHYKNMKFQKTNYRLDDLSSDKKLFEKICLENSEKLYLFLHEWSFREQYEILEKLWGELSKRRKIRFVLE